MAPRCFCGLSESVFASVLIHRPMKSSFSSPFRGTGTGILLISVKLHFVLKPLPISSTIQPTRSTGFMWKFQVRANSITVFSATLTVWTRATIRTLLNRDSRGDGHLKFFGGRSRLGERGALGWTQRGQISGALDPLVFIFARGRV